MVNSCVKGKIGERELCHWIKDNLGIEARRSQQYKGTREDNSADIYWDLPIYLECKRVESLSLYPTMERAAEDSGNQIPVIAHKKNRKDWLFIVRGEDLLKFCMEIVNATSGTAKSESGV